MWVAVGQEVHPAVAAAVVEACLEAAAPIPPPTWEEEEVAAVLEDQGAARPPSAALALDPPASPSPPRGSPSPYTTTTPRALKGPTDQQVRGHLATPRPLSPFPLTPIQTPPWTGSC